MPIGLILRPFTLDDVNEFYEMAHDPDVRRFLPYAYPGNRRKAKELIENYASVDFIHDFYYAICSEDGTILGAILSYKVSDAMTLDTSYMIRREYRNKGFMTAALTMFIDLICDTTEYDYLTFWVQPQNIPSMAIMHNLGIVRTGREIVYYYPVHRYRRNKLKK